MSQKETPNAIEINNFNPLMPGGNKKVTDS